MHVPHFHFCRSALVSVHFASPSLQVHNTEFDFHNSILIHLHSMDPPPPPPLYSKVSSWSLSCFFSQVLFFPVFFFVCFLETYQCNLHNITRFSRLTQIKPLKCLKNFLLLLSVNRSCFLVLAQTTFWHVPIQSVL